MKTIEFTEEEYIIISMILTCVLANCGPGEKFSMYKALEAYGVEWLSAMYMKFSEPPSPESIVAFRKKTNENL